MFWQVQEGSLYLLGITLLSLCGAFYSLQKSSKNNSTLRLSLLFFLTAFWSLTYFLELTAANRHTLVIANNLAWIPIVAVPLYSFFFILEITGFESANISRMKYLFYIPAFIVLFLVWTSQNHTLFYSSMDFPRFEGRIIMETERGMFFWLYILFAYLCLLLSLILSIVRFIFSRGIYKKQAGILIFGMLLPWIGSLVDLIYGTLGGVHFLQISFVLSEFLILFGIRKYSLSYLVPIGRYELVNRMDEMMLVINQGGLIIDANPSLARFIKKQEAEIIGFPYKEVFLHYPSICQFIEKIKKHYIKDTLSLVKEKKEFHFKTYGSPLFNKRNVTNGYLITFSDISNTVNTERQLIHQLENIERLQEKLKQQAFRDPLTDLYNRRVLDELSRQLLARLKREEGTIGILMIDIDHFKKLNDRFGHPAGDTVLCKLADIIKHHIRKTDIASRYGGEEFLLIYPDISREKLEEKANQLRKIFEETNFIWESDIIKATLSGGISHSSNIKNCSINELINEADQALYKAKDLGRNKIC